MAEKITASIEECNVLDYMNAEVEDWLNGKSSNFNSTCPSSRRNRAREG
ncbi:hypothetical protein BC936DRAFT_149592 [Jimgerdemannia flammicorona]|uniref:Uncharacterized protein n=1 Tax=Jimgerdemannia flammicorona TaxID=994334 RepID=A0A433D0J5_9FUNG|nr:hypothetical protein BC936DRAFT_149592 [Jimgerdemannia flammicorona]